MKKATIKDVARLAKVSTATVSNVMNNSRFVQQDTREKVLKSMEILNYRPSNLAKSMKGVGSKVIGLIIPSQEQDSSSELFSTLASGVESELQKAGYQLIIANSHERVTEEQSRLELFNSSMIEYVDGIIIAPTSGLLKNIDQIASNTTLPIVFVDRKPNDLERYDVVYTNNYSVTLELLEGIVNRGYEDIIFISGPTDVSSTIERNTAYEKIFYKLNGNKQPKRFETISSFEAGYRIGKEVVDSFEEKRSAIVFGNNTIAMGTIKYLIDHGISIPDDVGIAVYDDYSWMEIANTPLTAIRQPAFEMGRESAKLILDSINNQEHTTKRVEIPSKIIERKSL